MDAQRLAGGAPELQPEIDVSCPACGSRAGTILCDAAEMRAQQEEGVAFHRARLARRSRAAFAERATFTQDYATALRACSECGLLYRSPRPRSEAIVSAYARDVYPEERLPGMLASQRALFAPKAERLVRRVGPGARVLEVGSFVGGFLDAARAAGLRAVGIDPGAQLAAFCARRGLEVLPCTLDEAAAGASDRRFDAIAIWNTFDQLPDPGAAIRAAVQLLRSDGLLVLRVPHGPCFRWLLEARRAGGLQARFARRAMAWNNFLGFPYLVGHSLRSLDALVRPAGFVSVASEGDTLGMQADGDYTAWARLEERVTKTALRASAARDVGRAPWLDVLYALRAPAART